MQGEGEAKILLAVRAVQGDVAGVDDQIRRILCQGFPQAPGILHERRAVRRKMGVADLDDADTRALLPSRAARLACGAPRPPCRATLPQGWRAVPGMRAWWLTIAWVMRTPFWPREGVPRNRDGAAACTAGKEQRIRAVESMPRYRSSSMAIWFIGTYPVLITMVAVPSALVEKRRNFHAASRFASSRAVIYPGRSACRRSATLRRRSPACRWSAG